MQIKNDLTWHSCAIFELKELSDFKERFFFFHVQSFNINEMCYKRKNDKR